MDKFKSYTRDQVERALLDCHQTLIAGEYSPDHPYGRKLWAEIDALRDRSRALNKPLIDNLLWAARELAAGRELSVEGANYLCDAQDWLNAQKGAA